MSLPCLNLDSNFDRDLWNLSTPLFGFGVTESAQESNNYLDQIQYVDDMSSFSSDSKSSVETDPSVFLIDVEDVLNPQYINGTLPTTTLADLNTIEQSSDSFAPVFSDLSMYNQNAIASQQLSPSQSLQFSQPSWSSSDTICSSVYMQDLSYSQPDDSLGIESTAELEVSEDEGYGEEVVHSSNYNLSTFETVVTKQEPDPTAVWCQAPSPTPHQDNGPTETMQRHRGSKQPILYLVLYHALEHPEHYGDLIYWIDRSKGIFEFSSRNKECLARAWGIVKNNRCKMTYQKMSRALRIYIKKRVVLTKMKRKLQYVFRPDVLRKLCQRQQAGAIVSSDIAEIMYKESRHQRK